MNKIIFIVALMALAAAPARARLGDTMAQCEARYGVHVRIEESDQKDALHRKYLYEKSGYRISICYVDGIAGQVDIAREDGAALTEAEIKTLLESNSGGLAWKEVSGDNAPNPLLTGPQWIRDDGAHSYALDGISFTLKKYDEAVAAQRAKNDAAALKNF